MTTSYLCNGCGEIDSIVEISLVPRIMSITPDGDYGDDEAFWEAELVLGYGCRNESCKHWQGNHPHIVAASEDDEIAFTYAPDIDQIATVAE